ncbi:MAG TPA: hypothetical protein VLK58_07600 [Conexibacter sp.]|nr:hypothetical protein [Conexibacter sp.]
MTDRVERVASSLLGSAPSKTPSVRALSSYASHSDCATASLAFAARADLDRMCTGTDYESPIGQDPQAFQRGQTFEAMLKGNGYGALLDLLREEASFPPTAVRIEDLRTRYPRGTGGLKLRARETRRLLQAIANGEDEAPNLIDGAVITGNVAGEVAYYEADSLAAIAGGKLHVGEIKSFAYTDGRCDPEKFGAACDQAAWYILLCRRALQDMGLDPHVVSDEAFIILPVGVGLTPTLLRQNIAGKIRRAQTLLETAPDPAELLALHGPDLQFPGKELDPQARLDVLERLLDAVGTTYRPDSCLRDCGLAQLCRARAHDRSLPQLCGSQVLRNLPGVGTLGRAAELAAGAAPGIGEDHAARALRQASTVYDRVLAGGAL